MTKITLKSCSRLDVLRADNGQLGFMVGIRHDF